MDQSETLLAFCWLKGEILLLYMLGSFVEHTTEQQQHIAILSSFFFSSFPLFLYTPSYQSNFMATFERVKINNVYIYIYIHIGYSSFFYLSMDTIKFWPLASFFLVEKKIERMDKQEILTERTAKKNTRLNLLLMSFVDCRWMNSFFS